MRVLIVGAGAVGQVYGYHLQQAGAEVSFLVKARHEAEARRGFCLYRLNRRDRTTPVRFSGFGICTGAAQVAETRWDHVILAVSSTALEGDWLAELARAVPGAVVWLMQPGIHDEARLAPLVPESHRGYGLIGVVSYHGPLPGETRLPEPGVAVWYPPGNPTRLCGPRAAELVAALRKGGCPSVEERSLQRKSAVLTAAFQALIAWVEVHGWSFDVAAARPGRRQLARVLGQAMAAAGVPFGVRVPGFIAGVVARALPVVVFLARRLPPMDTETYFRVHFTKVGDQTRAHVRDQVALAEGAGLPSDALAELGRRMDEARRGRG